MGTFDLGSAGDLVIGLSWDDAASSQILPITVKVDGQTSTEIVTTEDPFGYWETGASLYAITSTASTVSMQVEFTGEPVQRCAIGIWRLTNVSSLTPVHTAKEIKNGSSITLSAVTYDNNSVSIAIAGGQPDDTGNTWSSMNEVFDIHIDGSSNGRLSGAELQVSSGSTGNSITITGGPSGRRAAAYANFV
jgi:hypothetical protein